MSYLLAILPAFCAFTGGAVWLLQASKELSHKRSELNFADKQLATYNARCARARDGPELQQALEQAQLSREIYQSVAEEYNRSIAKPLHRPAAWMLGYHSVLPE